MCVLKKYPNDIFMIYKCTIDKFANERVIKYYVEKNCETELKIITKGESESVVAVASIIARYLYVKTVRELSEEYGITLIKGASQKVKELKRSIKPEILPYLAKMHFKD